jgi:hypothetical protein
MKVTSKQADATLARLTTAMQRNTTLATGSKDAGAAMAGPVATYTPQPAPRRASQSIVAGPSGGRATGIRLKPDDNTKIREGIQAGLALAETLAVSDVIRIALRAYDPRHLSASDIAQLRARDGRSNPARLRGGSPATVTQ